MEGVRDQTQAIWHVAVDQFHEEESHINNQEDQDFSRLGVAPSHFYHVDQDRITHSQKVEFLNKVAKVSPHCLKIDPAAFSKKWEIFWFSTGSKYLIDAKGPASFFPKKVSESYQENQVHKYYPTVRIFSKNRVRQRKNDK